jgi:transposase-like protein
MATTKKRTSKGKRQRTTKKAPARKARRSFSKQFKQDSVNQVLIQGKTASSVAEALCISSPSLYLWLKQAKAAGATKTLGPSGGVTLYAKQEKKLSEAVAHFNERGIPIDRSMLIRFALNQTDLKKCPEPI